MERKQFCAVCSTKVKSFPRYPRYVCRDCANKTRAANGRPVEFANRDFAGGCVGRYADTHRPYRSQECFIDGVRCYADEAQLGGIVIQVVSGSRVNLSRSRRGHSDSGR
jgi:hypothetical protein